MNNNNNQNNRNSDNQHYSNYENSNNQQNFNQQYPNNSQQNYNQQYQNYNNAGNQGYYNQNYNLGLHGTHQVKNGFVALMTLFQLRKEGYSIDDKAILNGLKSVVWKGRFEQIMDNPIVYLDGAHNEDSVSVLLNNLNNRHKKAYHIFILHVYADKDVKSILKQLSTFPNEIICTSIYNERSLSAKNLYNLAKNIIPTNKLFLELSLRGAITLSLQHANIHRNTVITILGSLSHLEKSRNIIMEEK